VRENQKYVLIIDNEINKLIIKLEQIINLYQRACFKNFIGCNPDKNRFCAIGQEHTDIVGQLVNLRNLLIGDWRQFIVSTGIKKASS